jgi:hypothetical protein
MVDVVVIPKGQDEDMTFWQSCAELREAAALGEAVVFAERLLLSNTELVRHRVILLGQAVGPCKRVVDHLPARDILPLDLSH